MSDEPCWLNEDCIAGRHMDEIECRFPSWMHFTHKARPPHPDTMIGRK